MEQSSLVALVLRHGLALVFLLAAAGKLRALSATRQAARDLGVPSRIAPTVAVALPLVEATTAVGLLIPAGARWASVAALALVASFSLLVGVQLLRGRRPNCNCFGSGHESPIGPLTLVRNGLLAVAAAALLIRSTQSEDACALGCPSDLSSGQVTGLAGALVVAAVLGLHSWILVQLVRQRGDLLGRIELLEAVNSASTMPTALASAAAIGHDPGHRHRRRSRPGPAVGAPAPRFALRDPQGATVTIDDLLAGALPIVLVFLEPHCEACEALAVEIGDRAGSGKGPTDRRLVAMVAGSAAAVARIDARGFTDILVDEGGVITERYGVAGTPTAVVVLPDGRISSALAEGRAAATRLVRSPASAASASTATDPLPNHMTASRSTLETTEASRR